MSEKNENSANNPEEIRNEPQVDHKDEPQVDHEDNLELSTMSRRERRKAKTAKLKKNMENMSKGEKAGYIFSYYKWKIIMTIIVIAICIGLPLTIYKNTRPVAISYVIVNAEDPDTLNLTFVDDYIKTFNIKKPYRVNKDVDVHLDKETYMKEYMQNMDSSDYTELPLKCYNGFYDIIIMDEKGVEYCGMQEIIYPLKSYLPAELYSQVEDRIVETAGNNEVVVPFAIDISDTTFAKTLNLGYDKVYIGFPGATESNYKNAKRMLNYILGVEIEIY